MKDLSVRELNAIAVKRLQLTDEYVKTQEKLEVLLDQCRLSLSKTKAIVGFSNVSAGMVDNREVEETVRVELDKKSKKYVLYESENNGKRSYRPFGLLEPMSAKQARGIMSSALLIVCELASIKRELCDLSA